MDAFQQSGSDGEQWYLPEIERGGCTVEINSGLTFDPRFSLSGLHTTLAAVQSENGVSSVLEGSYDYTQYVDPAQKKQDMIRSWNRPTLNWSLECESQGLTRESALKTVTGSTILTQSPKLQDLRMTSISMIILFGLVCFCMSCGCFCAIVKRARIDDVEPLGFLICYGLQRVCYLLMMPFSFIAIFQSIDQVSSNQDKIESL